MIKGFPSRRDNIILAAIDIINEKGIQGLSTKEIALKQKISESILYKHFNSLDDVLIAVLEYFSKYDDMIINTALNLEASSQEKLITAIMSLVELYESYPALAAITQNYEIFLNYEHTKEPAIEIIKKRSDFIKEVFNIGQELGEFKNNFTKEEISEIIMGTFRSMIMTWKISGYEYSIKTKVLEVVKKILNGA